MTDWVTILRCDDEHRAAKAFAWVDDAWKVNDYDCGYLFSWEECEVKGLDDLSRLLFEIEEDRRAFVIRGEPIQGIDECVRRIKKGDERNSPSFRGVDRFWVMFDMDKAPVPPPEVATGPCVEAVQWAIATYLPEGFHGAACHYQWSNSAGIKPWSEGLRLHLFFWLDRSVCDASWRSWARARRGQVDSVDAAVYTPVQPHYTARPIVKGLADPVSPRSGLLPGSRSAAVPPELVDQATWDARLEQDERDRREAAAARPKPPESKVRDDRQAYARKALSGVCEEILGASEGARHDTINGGAYKIGRLLIAGGLDYGETLDALQNAALAVLPKSRAGEALRVPREALEAGMADPRDLADKGTRPGTATARSGAARRSAPESSAGRAGESATDGGTDAPPSPQGPVRSVSDWFCDRTRRLTIGGRLVLPSGELAAEVVPGVPGAPQSDARVPVGYYIAPWSTGWWKETANGPHKDEIVPCPLVISGKCVDIGTEVEHLIVSWKTKAGWRHRTIPRVDALNRGVQRLAECGLPITADGTKSLSKYLVAFEAANHNIIPLLRTSGVMGWQGHEGQDGFLIGRTHVAPTGRVSRVYPDRQRTEAWDSEAIAFRGSGGDDDVLADLYGVEHGEWRAWLEAIRLLAPYPRATLGIYAALAAPLLDILGGASFILDWAADPETGKTTAAAMAMSVWGSPDLIKRSWDSAGPYMENTLPALNSLPLWFDESQLAAKRAGMAGAADVISNAIYTFVQGRSKGAGTLTGTRRTRTWRTTLLSTGEQPLVSFCQRGGTRSRVIECVGLPFGARSASMASLSSFLFEQVTHHCGHAGVRWMRYLLEHRTKWSEWGELYRGLFKDYSEDSQGGRLAHARAILEVTYRLAETALELRLPNPMDALWHEVTAHAADATGAEAALADVVSWFAANRASFKGSGYDNKAPTTGWLGVWHKSKTGTLVGFVPASLEKFLRDRGYQVPSILAAWRAKGWCVVDLDRPNRATKTVWFEGASAKLTCLQSSLFAVEKEVD